jgi:RimJ/RimL family protein N-acetyltransferase
VRDYTLILRPVTMDDARLLHTWRNDPETREASRNSNSVSWREHKVWLSAAIASPDRVIHIACDAHKPVGVVRADRADGWELSWTVAPEARGRGIGQRMLQQFAAGFDGRLTAIIRKNNIASGKIAAAAGFVCVGPADVRDFELWARS